MTIKLLVFRYLIFALIAIFFNLLSQRIVFSLSSASQSLFLAIFIGTLVGLFVKYYLDKKWIFFDKTIGLKANSNKFFLYTIMGIFTTIIFWGFEIFFWFIWQTNTMRELGAIIGLSIGYLIKYSLDRRFVFNSASGGALS